MNWYYSNSKAALLSFAQDKYNTEDKNEVLPIHAYLKLVKIYILL